LQKILAEPLGFAEPRLKRLKNKLIFWSVNFYCFKFSSFIQKFFQFFFFRNFPANPIPRKEEPAEETDFEKKMRLIREKNEKK
jgi:hypothetical protein